MEELLHYVWKHKLLPLRHATTDGRTVEIVDPGTHNNDAGPDFFNAKVRIDGTLWIGNIEIHVRSSDWYAHGHDHDRAYDNVILHAAEHIDCDVEDAGGRRIPQIRLEVPKDVADNYAELLREAKYPPCYRIIPGVPAVVTHSWLAALQAERLERKTVDIRRRADTQGGSWERALFVTLARNYGFGVNSDAFEQWANTVSLDAAAHHRDDLFQTEAIFIGQAGLLDHSVLPPSRRDDALNDVYFKRLSDEYAYLAHKFGLRAMDGKTWRFARLRPQSFPYIRLSQIATMYCERRCGLREIVESGSYDELQDMLRTRVSTYWQTHHTFGAESKRSEKRLTKSSADLLMINTVIPFIFAYGRYTASQTLCSRALALFEKIAPEDNKITRAWAECGLPVSSAADSQALIQLKKEYCDRKDCLRCRFGYEYLKGRRI